MVNSNKIIGSFILLLSIVAVVLIINNVNALGQCKLNETNCVQSTANEEPCKQNVNCFAPNICTPEGNKLKCKETTYYQCGGEICDTWQYCGHDDLGNPTGCQSFPCSADWQCDGLGGACCGQLGFCNDCPVEGDGEIPIPVSDIQNDWSWIY